MTNLERYKDEFVCMLNKNKITLCSFFEVLNNYDDCDTCPYGFESCEKGGWCNYRKFIDWLLEEHFDNPPLEFEELKPNMWVWDDIDKEYRKVYGKGIYLGDEYLMKTGCKVVFISEDEYFNLIYEPNRFYRKEVQI